MVQAKKVRKGNEINLVVLAFSGPMNEMILRPGVQVIGGVELTDNLIVCLRVIRILPGLLLRPINVFLKIIVQFTLG